MINRIIGACLIILISVPLIFLGGAYFKIFCSILGIFALKEVIDLKKHHDIVPKFVYFLSGISLIALILLPEFDSKSFSFNFSYMATSLSILFLLIPCIFYEEKNYSSKTAIYLIGSAIFLGFFFNSLILIREYSIYHLFYLIFIAIFNDNFAFLIGKTIGKHKCSPKISPNKTWEGTIGGILIGSIISVVFYLRFINELNIFILIIITIILSIMGTLGDLILSKIKRENDIKDFSSIIIGHGGILDRLDSLIFIVYTYIIVFGII